MILAELLYRLVLIGAPVAVTISIYVYFRNAYQRALED